MTKSRVYFVLAKENIDMKQKNDSYVLLKKSSKKKKKSSTCTSKTYSKSRTLHFLCHHLQSDAFVLNMAKRAGTALTSL